MQRLGEAVWVHAAYRSGHIQCQCFAALRSASQRYTSLHKILRIATHRYASHRLACALVGPRVRSGLSSANALDFSSSQNVTPVVLFCSKTSGTMNV